MNYKEFSKDEIKNIMKNIKPLKYNGHNKEKFKQIIYKNHYIPYIISSYGRLFSIYFKGSNKINLKQIKTTFNKKGYERVNIAFDNNKIQFMIHVVVALIFIKNKNPEKYIMVNHIDGIKSNNFYWNLEWCTAKHNIQHAEKTGLRKHVKGENHGKNKHPESLIKYACELIQSNEFTLKEISDKTNISSKLLYRIYKGKVWIDISKDYDFSNYTKCISIDPEKQKDRKKQLHNVCKMLADGKHTMKEISEITGINYKIVNGILNRKKYLSISKDYDFSNFYKSK